MRRRLVFAFALLTATAFAQNAQWEVEVLPGAPGPNRLQLDVRVMARAKPLRYTGGGFIGGMEDLRLYDSAGQEVPYLLAISSTEPVWRRGSVLPIRATKRSSGFEADLGAMQTIDRIRVQGLPAPFLKRFTLEGSGDRQRWTVLVGDGTFFDLPDERLRNLEAAFSPGTFRYFRVTWDDRSSARMPLPRDLSARISAPGQQVVTRAPMNFTPRQSEPRKSRYRLVQPFGPNLPVVAIVPEVSDPHVFRPATVSEYRLSGGEVLPVVLGSAQLRRVERGGAAADDLRIPIQRPQGPELELVVDDGDNPPLALTGVHAELAPLPWIYFESAGGPLVARFGDTRREAPRYDLEAVREVLPKRQMAEARWGAAVTPGDGERAAGDDLPLVPTGASLNAEEFRYQREVPSSGEGLTSLLLDAAVLARSRNLEDVRIVTADGRQVPYLLERRDEPLSVDLEPLRRLADTRRGISRYELELPYADLPEAKVVLTTSQRIFERPVRAMVVGGRDEISVIASELWRHSVPETPPPQLMLNGVAPGHRAIILELDEGENEPLPLDRPRLLLPAYRLRFLRSGAMGQLRLVYGNTAAQRPRYDVALLAPRLFGMPAREVTLGGESEKPVPRLTRQQTVFWAAVIAAVLALLVVVSRLLRGEAQRITNS